MIEYRAIKQSELELAVTFCNENGLEFPIPYEIAFGAFKEGVLIGLCALKKMYQIEPLISNGENGIVAQILAEKTMAVASMVTNEIVALCKDTSNAKMFTHYGFKLRDDNITFISKDI